MNVATRTVTGSLVFAMLAGCAAKAPAEVLAEPGRFGVPVALPSPDTNGTVPLETVITRRRSQRDFSPVSLPLATIGQLLWAGQGITDSFGRRTAPSAGGLYPLELYVVTANQLIHYLPAGHRVESRKERDLRGDLQHAALDQASVGGAPAVIVVAAVVNRTAAKYGRLAAAFVDLEAGHAAQNMLLEATALRLAAVPVGGINPSAVGHLLLLPPEQKVLYLLPVGYPAA